MSSAETATAVIVDDSLTSRNALRLMLERAGVRGVGEATTGEEVLSVYEAHRPTLLILDIILPRVDGVTAARRLLQAHPQAAVVMCSSITARERVLECREAGVAHFILKPLTFEKIAQVVRSVLGRASRAEVPAG